ncbi:MAG: hypothetical protein OQK12_10495 [Motiliproteus sp.]|nr:hypothetical protein [Motiliproteus sp.]MCW9050974.1 hypothetical protein [Motiliproteus sp.]
MFNKQDLITGSLVHQDLLDEIQAAKIAQKNRSKKPPKIDDTISSLRNEIKGLQLERQGLLDDLATQEDRYRTQGSNISFNRREVRALEMQAYLLSTVIDQLVHGGLADIRKKVIQHELKYSDSPDIEAVRSSASDYVRTIRQLMKI